MLNGTLIGCPSILPLGTSDYINHFHTVLVVPAPLSAIPILLVISVMVAPWLLAVKLCYLTSIILKSYHPIAINEPKSATASFLTCKESWGMVVSSGPCCRNAIPRWVLWSRSMTLLQHSPSWGLCLPSAVTCHEKAGLSTLAWVITFSGLLRALPPRVCPIP